MESLKIITYNVVIIRRQYVSKTAQEESRSRCCVTSVLQQHYEDSPESMVDTTKNIQTLYQSAFEHYGKILGAPYHTHPKRSARGGTPAPRCPGCSTRPSGPGLRRCGAAPGPVFCLSRDSASRYVLLWTWLRCSRVVLCRCCTTTLHFF